MYSCISVLNNALQHVPRAGMGTTLPLPVASAATLCALRAARADRCSTPRGAASSAATCSATPARFVRSTRKLPDTPVRQTRCTGRGRKPTAARDPRDKRFAFLNCLCLRHAIVSYFLILISRGAHDFLVYIFILCSRWNARTWTAASCCRQPSMVAITGPSLGPRVRTLTQKTSQASNSPELSSYPSGKC